MVGMGREQGRNSPQAQFSPPPTSPPLEILPLLVEIVHPHYHDWAHSESSSGAPSDWPKPPFQSNQLLSISTSMPWETNVLTKCAPPEL